MGFEQFTYTGSPWGATAPGWTVFQSSAGIGTDAASEFKPYFRFPGDSPVPDSVAGEIDGRKLPIRFVFATDKATGRHLIAQSLDAGLRWYDTTRGRDYFAHVFVQTDGGTVPEDVPVGFNPAALVLSPSIQTEFPDEFRDKALQIMNGERPNEPTPDLPTLGSLSEIEPNERYTDENLFDRLSPDAVEKLGGLVTAMSGLGQKTFFFDATKPESLDCLASCVRLIPLSIRMKLNFATWIPANEVQAFPEIETFSFVGTIRSGEASDPDTGLYGKLPQGGPEFRSREDVERFKEMVDAGGTKLKEGDFDDLVLCWEVAAGRRTDVDSLRKAVQFAKPFPKMKDKVVSGLENAGLDPMPTVVARFELNLTAFEGGARQVCDDCVRDGALFAESLRTLDGDAARKAFADAVAEGAEANGTTAELATMWLGCPPDVRALLLRNVTGPFVSLATLADRFDALRRDVADGRVERDRADGLLDEADRAAGKLGDGFEGMKETRNALRYLAALDKLNGVEGVPSFVQDVREYVVDEEKIRSDVLDRVKPGDIPVERLAGNLDAFEVVGIPKEELLRLVIEAAEERGRDEGERSGQQLARIAESHGETVVRTRVIPPWIAAAVGAVALAIGLVSGCFFGSSLVAGKAPVTENRKLSPLPPVLQPQGTDLPIRQPDDSSDVSTQSTQSPLDEPSQSPRTFPSQSQQMLSLDLPQMPAPGSPQQPPQASSVSQSIMSRPETASPRELQASPRQLDEPEPTTHDMPLSWDLPEPRKKRVRGRQMQESSSTQSVLSDDGDVRSGGRGEWR